MSFAEPVAIRQVGSNISKAISHRGSVWPSLCMSWYTKKCHSNELMRNRVESTQINSAQTLGDNSYSLQLKIVARFQRTNSNRSVHFNNSTKNRRRCGKILVKPFKWSQLFRFLPIFALYLLMCILFDFFFRWFYDLLPSERSMLWRDMYSAIFFFCNNIYRVDWHWFELFDMQMCIPLEYPVTRIQAMSCWFHVCNPSEKSIDANMVFCALFFLSLVRTLLCYKTI